MKVVSEIHDPVTTTDELIPSGETSSYRSNPLGTGRVYTLQKRSGLCGTGKRGSDCREGKRRGELPGGSAGGIKAGVEDDQSQLSGGRPHEYRCGKYDLCCEARRRFCQRAGGFLPESSGGWANIANEYATKRYRSNLINWGMLPFVIGEGELPFERGIISSSRRFIRLWRKRRRRLPVML